MAKKKKITFEDKIASHSELLRNPKNPRYIKDDRFDKLVTSIQEFEEMLNIRPLVVDESLTILGGNMRLKAIKELGIEKVPIKIVKGLTEKQKEEFTIKDNVGYGEWNWDVLANEWEVEDLEHWGLDTPVTPTTKPQIFRIKCEDEQQLIELQEYFDTTNKSLEFATFKDKLK
jgi:hypothetical protein